MTDIRKSAILVLEKVLEEKKFFNEVKNNLADENSQDIAFLNMLCLTCFRHLNFINKTLKTFIKKKQNSNFANYAITLAVTEMLYLDTPDYAVINSYVNLIKKETDKYVSGFANAVLRNIARQKEEIIKQDDNSFFPDSFKKILSQDYNKETISLIEQASLSQPLLDISTLEGETVRLENSGKIQDIVGYNDGLWWVQDYAAAIAVNVMNDVKGKNVLDICAAPGGKTAQLIAKGANVTALDVSETRLEKLKENLNRLKMSVKNIICSDGLSYLKDFNEEPFDAILLDAPCSAIGTLRRHPELVFIKNMEDIKKQTSFQNKFLSNIKNALKIGGELVYCTCSLSKLEGERQIADFLRNNTDFELVKIESKQYQQFITKDGYIRTLPHLLDQSCDGFFVAKLKRIA